MTAGTPGWRPTGPLTLETAGAALAEARRAVADGVLRVDLSGVPRADSAGLALLLDIVREAARRGQVLDIVGMPAGLRSLADLYGVTDLLPLDEAAPGA